PSSAFHTQTASPTSASFVCSIGRRRPATFFPYTTLFRSHSPQEKSGCFRAAPSSAFSRATVPALRLHGNAQRPRDRNTSVRAQADRKSTRLNSSHLGISYAVFCLKTNTLRLAAVDLLFSE